MFAVQYSCVHIKIDSVGIFSTGGLFVSMPNELQPLSSFIETAAAVELDDI